MCSVQIGFPHTATLGRLPGTQVFRNMKQYPGARTIPGVLVVQIDAPFYFASVHVSDASYRAPSLHVAIAARV